MSLKPAKRAKKGFKGGVRGEAAGALGVPQHTSLSSPVAHIPSSTSSVPIFSLD